MELNEIANRGKLVNGVIIGVNIVTFAVYMFGRFADYSTGLIVFQNIIRVIGGIIAVGGIVYTAILMKHNEGRLKGLGLCLASCICSLVFSVIGCMIGIVIWVLSGISMKQLDKSFAEEATMNMWSKYGEIKGGDVNSGYQDPYGAPQNNYGGYQDPYGAPQNNYGGYQDPYGAPQNNTGYQDPFAAQNNPSDGSGNNSDFT